MHAAGLKATCWTWCEDRKVGFVEAGTQSQFLLTSIGHPRAVPKKQ